MKRFFIFLGVVLVLAIIATFFALGKTAGNDFAGAPEKSEKSEKKEVGNVAGDSVSVPVTLPSEPSKPMATHLKTPVPVKAFYISMWTASSANNRQHIVNLLDTTEANAIVIDIKDSNGRVSFLVDNPVVSETGSPENIIKDIGPFIEELHAKNIYVIGRISTFQDSFLTKVKPDWAIHKKSDGTVWKDRKGFAFLDPANREVWDYTVALAKASYAVGFDEINFDYIRYPSDGDLKNIDYKLGEGKTRADNIETFFAHLSANLRVPLGITTSADLFGLTTTENTDMGIGQVLERALPYFDYIAPMVYPSHYDSYKNITKPATHPYEVVKGAMEDGIKKITALTTPKTVVTPASNSTTPGTASTEATTTIIPVDPFYAHVNKNQLRPWLQDFSIRGVTYTADMIKAEKRAVYDAGLDSWMMWDPSNKYVTAAYEKDPAP